MNKLYLEHYKEARALSDWLLFRGFANFVRRDNTLSEDGGMLMMSEIPTRKAIATCKQGGVKFILKR